MEGFRRWMKEQITQRAEPADETRSSSEGEEDPVDEDEDEEGKEEDDEEEDEEEEEDPGSSEANGSGDKDEDEDSPPASAHRPITWSTPKKPVSRPKRKAYWTKGSGPGNSSRKQSRDSQE